MKKTNLLSLSLLLMATALLTGCGGGSSAPGIELFPVANGDTYGYVNRKGEIVINPQFENAGVFRNGVALVKPDGQPAWAYINTKGEYVSEKRYLRATAFSDGLAWTVEENQAPAAIDPKGNVKFTLKEAQTVRVFYDGLAAFSNAGSRWGFVDRKGKVVIEPRFFSVDDFSEGLCAVLDSTGKYGYINRKGEYAIASQFDRAMEFRKGLAVVELDDKYGAVDKSGKYVINPQFKSMTADGELFLIIQDGKTGWCDAKGKYVINPQFRDAYPFCGSSIAAVRSGDNWGYVDKKGSFAINPQFSEAFPFSGNVAIVESGSQYGMIDKAGKYTVNPQFKRIYLDIISYLSGKIMFHSVETDYFNAEDVVACFSFGAPEGLNAASSYGEILGKFGVTQGSFSKSSDYCTVIKNKKAGAKVTYSFTVNGSPYDKKQVTKSGWWSSYTTTESVFNGDRKPKSYAYSIKTGDHTDEIWKLIDQKLSASCKAEYDENLAIYSGDGIVITLDESNPYLTVRITFKKETADAAAE
jgi:hypothetical protein